MTDRPAPRNQGAPSGPRRSAPFNRWLRYPAGFGSDAAAFALESAGLVPGGVMLDPFAGVATLAPWLASRGVRFVGVEANPLIARFADLKAGPWPSPEALRVAADHAGACPTLPEARLANEHEVVQACFDAETLRELITLREAADNAPDAVRPWLLLALAGTLRDVASSSVGWPYQRPSRDRQPRHANARIRFAQRVDWLCEDIGMTTVRVLGSVSAGDSRQHSAISDALGGAVASACVTSPPYLNNYDYADATRLELYFFGLADSWATMCRYARDAMVVASTQQTRDADAEEARLKLSSLSWWTEAEPIWQALRTERSSRPRGKEYDRLFLQYFRDLARVLENLMAVLAADSRVVLVVGDSAPYGVRVDTPGLLARMSEELGFRFKDSVVVRKRGHRWAKNGQRRQVNLVESVTVLNKP